MKLLCLLMSCLLATHAFARCVGTTLDSQLKSSEIVVVAEVINSINLFTIDPPKCGIDICSIPLGPFATLIRIDEVLKGSLSVNKKIFILQQNSGDSISLKKGNKYLIFADKVAEELYFSHQCAGSMYADEAGDVLAAIRDAQKHLKNQ